MEFKQQTEALIYTKAQGIKVQVVRYLISGGLAFSLDFAVLVALTDLAQVHYLISAATGFCAGWVLTYFLNRFWVFSLRKFDRASVEFGVFALIAIFALAITELVIWFFTDLVGLHYTLSKVIAVAINMTFNFIMRKRLVFS